MDIRNANALVTGANRGLGHGLVAALLSAGAGRVYAAARDPDKLDATTALDPARVKPLRLDITDKNEIAAAVEQASDVTLLINNAGVLDFAGPMAVTDAVIDRNMQTNFYGTMDMTRAFVPVIEAHGGGAVVNVLTFLSFVSAPIFSAYNVSKAASWSMAMSLRPLVAGNGVAIVNVFPTTIDTEMVAGLEKAKSSPREVADDIVQRLSEGAEDIYPLGAQDAFDAWRADQKAVERQFGQIV